MPFQWFTQAILLQEEQGEEKCCDELIAQQKVLMKGKEREAQAEPGICPDEHANEKLVGRHFLLIFWQIVSGLWKSCSRAMLGRAVGEPGDQSWKILHLKPGMRIKINRWALTQKSPEQRTEMPQSTVVTGAQEEPEALYMHLSSSSTTWNLIPATLDKVFFSKIKQY